LSRDPLSEKAGFNLYSFSYNSPTMFVDPNGFYAQGVGTFENALRNSLRQAPRLGPPRVSPSSGYLALLVAGYLGVQASLLHGDIVDLNEDILNGEGLTYHLERELEDHIQKRGSIVELKDGEWIDQWGNIRDQAGNILRDKNGNETCYGGLKGFWIVGPHSRMPNPRPPGMQSHHGVNSIWMEANVPGYDALNAPAILMLNDPNHNATRRIFNKFRIIIAKRQGVGTDEIDWSAVPPGTAWALAEEQLQAAGVPPEIQAEFFRQFNQYLHSLP
jgi:hypothetical protein